jgi:hypothetical protein
VGSHDFGDGQELPFFISEDDLNLLLSFHIYAAKNIHHFCPFINLSYAIIGFPERDSCKKHEYV